MARVNTLIDALIKIKGKTQTELSTDVGISRFSIHRFLAGESELRTDSLVELLKFLDVDLEKILETEIDRSLGKSKNDLSLGEAVETMLQEVDPIFAKTFIDSLSNRMKTKKSTEVISAMNVINQYKDKIKTVRRN